MGTERRLGKGGPALAGLKGTVIGRGPLGIMSALALVQNGATVVVIGADPIREGVGFVNAAGLLEPVATREERAARWTADSVEFFKWASGDPAWGVIPREVLFLSDEQAATEQGWIVEMGRREATTDELDGRRAYGAWFPTVVVQPDLAVTAIKREAADLGIVGLTRDQAMQHFATLDSVEAAAERALGQRSDFFVLAAGLGIASLTDIEDLTGMASAAGMSAGMGLTIRIPIEDVSPRLDHVLMDDDDLGYLIPQKTHVIAGGTNDIAEHDDPIVSSPHPALMHEWEAEVRSKIEHLLPGAGDLQGDVRLGARPMRHKALTHWTEEFPVPGILLGGAGGSGWTFSVGMAHDVCRVIAERFGRQAELLALGTERVLSRLTHDGLGAAA